MTNCVMTVTILLVSMAISKMALANLPVPVSEEFLSHPPTGINCGGELL